MQSSSTIFAIATPPGRSALAVIRISGPQAHTAPSLFSVKMAGDRRACRASLKASDGSVLDDVIIISFSAPASATGEDIIEIHCHGSQAVISEILDILSAAPGFCVAVAGEFTRRGLENGKMDITQAEGLADLIDAETSLQRRQAAAQMQGTLSKPVLAWRQDIIELSALLEALIDFADEELPPETVAHITSKRQLLLDNLRDVLDHGRRGEIIRNGLTAALVGPVNAGKSTALNLLTGRSVAIVSHHAGTTRDVLEAKIDISGIPLTLLDTAGVRETRDEIEGEGIRRAEERARDADILMIIVDGSRAGWSQTVSELVQWAAGDCLIIVNKADMGLIPENILEKLPEKLSGKHLDRHIIYISLQEQDAGAKIEAQLSEMVPSLNLDGSSALITRARHRAAFTAAFGHLSDSVPLNMETESELVAEEFRAAAVALGRITGHVDVEDVLDHVFSRFCIGK